MAVSRASREEREGIEGLSVVMQEITIEGSMWDKKYFSRILSKRGDRLDRRLEVGREIQKELKEGGGRK